MALYGVFRDENKIIFLDRINWFTFVEFCKNISETIDQRGYSKVILDFSRISKAYPNGMVPIIAEIYLYLKRGCSFPVIPPRDTVLLSLFQRNGWLYYLAPEQCKPPKVTGFTNLPLQKFNNDEELNDIVNRAVEVCLQQLVFAEGVPQAFEWALNEIAGNVLVHSETDLGWIQVVTYKESRHLALIVCDAGVGIPKSMSALYQCKDDQEALEMALRQGVTSKPNFGQGNGLAGSLAIAQHSKGTFALTSHNARIYVSEGKVEAGIFLPHYKGTCVEMQFSTDIQINLPTALWGHQPVDYMEIKFEDDNGKLSFRLKDYASSFGNRITGERIKNLVVNLLIQNHGKAVEIVMDDVSVISSSFADELFGKLFFEMGPVDFSRLISFKGLNSICKSIIELAIYQRIAQNVTNVTPVK
ncbi:MAG TPA: DUF4325 domain-containing protein [Roseiflexaceae bacterium]|nr:DUF4325 domain-containing protein [Roseiflexaceae bacterium]